MSYHTIYNVLFVVLFLLPVVIVMGFLFRGVVRLAALSPRWTLTAWVAFNVAWIAGTVRALA